MGPLELTTIRQLINAHRVQTHDMWKSLSAILDHRDEESLSQYVLTFLQRQGLTTSLLSSHPTGLYGEMRYKTMPSLLYYLNYDPEAPASPQAQAIAASLLSLYVYQNLLATRADLSPITVKWVLGQKSMSHRLPLQDSIMQRFALLQADACLWYEPVMTERVLQGNSDNLVLATGTKGYLSVELQVQTAHSLLHSSYGAIAPNAAWRLLWALNSLKDQQEEILIEGFYDTMQPLDDDAFQGLADWPDTAVGQAARWGIPELVMGLQGTQMHYAHVLTPTCTINGFISGGEVIASSMTPGSARTGASSVPTIPATASAIVDFYLVPGQDPVDIFDKLKRHLCARGFADIDVTLRYAGAPAYTSVSHSFGQQVVQSAERVYGCPPFILPLLPEHVPICTITSSPSQPVVIFPLYAREQGEDTHNEYQDLCDDIAFLTHTMLHLKKDW